MDDDVPRALARRKGHFSRLALRRPPGWTGPPLRARLGLVALGLIWGLVVPLSGLAAGFGVGPFALAGWVAAISSLLSLAVALQRGTMFVPKGRTAGFFLVWALLGTVVPQTLLFWVASRIASSTISVIVILEGFIVFALATLLRLEKPTLRRFGGLALGFLGLVPVLSGAACAPDADLLLTLLAVLGLPVCYALENLLIATCKPAEIDPIAGIALMQGIGAAVTLSIAASIGDFVWLALPGGRLEFVIVSLGACAALANVLFQSLISTSGSVFTSQCSYLITLAGIGWSVLILGETLSPWIGASLTAIFLGILLVTPHSAPSAGRSRG